MGGVVDEGDGGEARGGPLGAARDVGEEGLELTMIQRLYTVLLGAYTAGHASYGSLVGCTVCNHCCKGNSLTRNDFKLRRQRRQPHRMIDVELDQILSCLPVIQGQVQISSKYL